MSENKTTYYFFSFACGMVDAICFAKLGGVFVSLMTGNMILLGLAIGQLHPVETYYSFLVPLTAYALGTYAGGWVSTYLPGERTRKLAFCFVWLLLLSSVLLSSSIKLPSQALLYYLLLLMLGTGAGLQSALLQQSGLKNFASNVMTSTLTSMLVEFPKSVSIPRAMFGGRLLSILFFLIGVISGAVAVSYGVTLALSLALIPLGIAVSGVISEQL